MSDYTLTGKQLRSMKAAVTRAKNKGDWQAVILACDKALKTFDAHGFPDCWADFEREKDDATLRLAYHSGRFA